jgi:geranylgeranyl diphosphate synthase type II
MELLKKYQDLINHSINTYPQYKPLVQSLYTPAHYALEGGKKIRPTLVLMAAQAFGAEPKKALPAALAIETFHNFTLVHDDVMDHSPIRRGRKTVYKKWDINQAILTGDAMLLLAFRHLYLLDSHLIPGAIDMLTWVGLRISEGQQLDMEFETRREITEQEYLKMIELKTAVLLGISLKLGAFIAGASEQDQQLLYNFGRLLGIAFQIQDDYMDLYADQDIFGKKIGNDIATNKKTYLLIRALELADRSTRDTLLNLFTTETTDTEKKVQTVSEIYNQLGIKQLTEQKITEIYSQAKAELEQIADLNDNWRAAFSQLADYLMKRKK